jgi:competence protein ComEC
MAAAVFASGIWLAEHFYRPPVAWAGAAAVMVVCAVVAAMARSLRLAQISVVLALLCTGALDRMEMPVSRAGSPPADFLSGERLQIEGHVTSDGALLPGGGLRERFDLETESIHLSNRTFTQPVGIRVTTFAKNNDADLSGDPQNPTSFPQLAYGDRVRCIAKLRPPRNFRNPGAFDYEGYLRGLSITALGTVDVDEIELLPGKSGSHSGFWRSRIRRSILAHITGSAPGLWGRDDSALFAAMIVGDESLLVRDVREEFQATGVYHLLVVSGMNVALLALAVFWLARRLRVPEWAAALATLALSVFYAYIAGMGVPIERAVLMLAVFLGARLLYRERSALNATGFAALAVLMVSPSALFEAGFQLTFLALLAIAGIGLPLLERTSIPCRRALQYVDSSAYDLALEPRLAQFRLDLRLVMGRLARFIGVKPAQWLIIGSARLTLAGFELIVVSSITQAVLVLPMRIYFHRAAVIGLPANMLVLPLAGLMLNSAVAAVGLSYVSFPVARVAAWVAAAALHWTLACLRHLAHLHISQWRVPDAGWGISLVAAAGIAAALFAVRRQRPVAATGLVTLVASAAAAAFFVGSPRLAPDKLEITAVDVGQGDALLVISPEGRTMLVDGGGTLGPAHGEFDFGEDVVSPYLWTRGLERLDVVALSHAHGDHIGGLARTVENFQPRELWVGINPETPETDRLYAAAAVHGVSIRQHTAGDEFDWGGVHVRVLAPPPGWHPKPRPMNDDSLAFVLSLGKTRALLAGDLERKMEKFVAAESPRADLLKVAHHGSATSTTPELLAAVQPSFAVISVGAHNSFGHPRTVVLQRLQDAHVLTYRTDIMGLVTFLLDGKKVEAKPGGF